MTQSRQETMNKLFEQLREEVIPLLHKVLSDVSPVFSEPSPDHSVDDIDSRSPATQLLPVKREQEQLLTGDVPCPMGTSKGSPFENGQDCCNCAVLESSCPALIQEIGNHLHTMSQVLGEQNLQLAKHREYISVLQRELSALSAELRAKEKEIHDMMITDKLTTLYNRQHLVTVLEDEIARCQRYNRPIALIMIDIDRFKAFNETYGHQSGDHMLTFAGSLIKDNTRKFDRAFRYGGEEFVIVLPESDLTMAYIVAERIRKDFGKKSFQRAVKNSGESADANLSCTISAGITATFAYGTQAIHIEALISQTESALREAKEKGGNICIRYEQ